MTTIPRVRIGGPITSNADDYNAVQAVIYTSTAALSAGDIAAFREQQCPAAQTDLDTAGVQEYLQRYKGVYISNLDNIVINGTGATAMVRYRYDTSINPTAEAITEPTPPHADQTQRAMVPMLNSDTTTHRQHQHYVEAKEVWSGLWVAQAW